MINELQPTLFRDVERSPRLPADVTANRHKGNAASIDANPSEAAKRESHRQILAFISFMGKATSKAIARELGKPLNAVSGRVSELKALGEIEETGERDEGCNVLRIRR